MNFLSTDSNISSAEELTEDMLSKDIDHVSQIEQISEASRNTVTEFNKDGLSVDDKSCLSYAGSEISSSFMYSAIRPEHVRILDLQVESHLKPDYVLSNKDSVWLTNDRVLDDMKCKGIIRYLSNDTSELDKEIESLTRTLGHENLRSVKNQLYWSRRGSLDTGLNRRMCKSELKKNNGSEDSSLRDDEHSDNYDLTSESDLLQTGIIEELEFQASLKNERCHFVFSEQLICGIEVMHSEEYYYDMRHGRNNVMSSTLSLKESEPINVRSTSHSSCTPTTCSSSETITMTFISEIRALVAQLSANDHRQRRLSADLHSLLSRLERRSKLSTSLDKPSPQHQPLVSSKQSRCKPSNSQSNDNQSEITEAMIKAAIGNFTSNLPVGGCPILGPDMSLPGYVVSRYPPPAKRSVTLSLQQNTCPGCQCAFQPEVARRLRLCHYYYLYFCSVCHSNTLMLIPARILQKWDFTMLPVSRPARDLLQLIHAMPLFAVTHFSDTLQSSLSVLISISRLRRQGRLLLDFIEICRHGSYPLTRLLDKLPSHWFQGPPFLFSIADFVLINSGHMEPHLRNIVTQYIEHISLCPVCQARGFLCELCDNKSQIIFPFEIDLVCQCPECHACFHRRCYNQCKGASCPRCERRRIREQQSKIEESHLGGVKKT